MTGVSADSGTRPKATTPERTLDQRPFADIDASALAARLKAVIGEESVSSFARRCGMAESVLRTYLRDGRMPPLDRALAIAAAAGVSVDWLATGRGARAFAQVTAAYSATPEASTAPAADAPVLNAAVLEGIVKAVLQGQGGQASAEQLAAMIVDLYQRALERGTR
ncbi:MAG: helix-turn-helix protein [Candidatus Accumulibacter appositus]|uniref:Helix-turn-helix protein n=1 Tax=Candidatus Accumulibacter appositus TaxID=1454003 RepID=A0A011P3D9_9PROT|nr:helix-turn-helix domain-containing protein [Accumulibacter sp.]EXI82131.1 MAG: helix-turn-helix protein [Candidatus Accumulibacter appositus]HRF03413.1 helix-turn-helix domain-containing protein [Accumulibacter sp.]